MEGEVFDQELGLKRFLKVGTGILCVAGSLFILHYSGSFHRYYK